MLVCQWIASAVKDVMKLIVRACFRRTDFSDISNGDPEDNIPLMPLVDATREHLKIRNVMDTTEFIHFDNDVPVKNNSKKLTKVVFSNT